MSSACNGVMGVMVRRRINPSRSDSRIEVNMPRWTINVEWSETTQYRCRDIEIEADTLEEAENLAWEHARDNGDARDSETNEVEYNCTDRPSCEECGDTVNDEGELECNCGEESENEPRTAQTNSTSHNHLTSPIKPLKLALPEWF